MDPLSVPWELVLGLVLLALLAWYLTWTAARLDRLHARVEGSRAALDAQLLRRAAATHDLATSGLLDPASSILLADAAYQAREADGDARELAESRLTAALRAALEQDGAVEALRADATGRVLLQEVEAAGLRVQLARRFHNDAVRAALVVRRARVVRTLRLAGRAPLPPTVELDDEPPAPLAR